MTLTKAFDHMTSMAHHINEMKRKHEHAVRVQEIQSQLEDYEGEDLTRLGELVLEACDQMPLLMSCNLVQFYNSSLKCSARSKKDINILIHIKIIYGYNLQISSYKICV
jgi:hypothetical protein